MGDGQLSRNADSRHAPGSASYHHRGHAGPGPAGNRRKHRWGNGSRFSLFPPENAAGNYVKVVQRIPVRIRIEPGQPGLDRLRPGMSVEPEVLVR